VSGVWKTKSAVLSQYTRNAQLSALVTRPAGAIVGNPHVNLTHDPAFNPTPTTTLAALVAQVASFSGYVPVVPVPVAPVNLDPATQGMIWSAVFEATVASPFVGDTITGYWEDDGTNMVLAEAFGVGNSIPIAAPNDYVQIDGIYPLASPQVP
jgi:hypothetical protein